MAIYRPHADFNAPFAPADSTAEINALFDQIRSDGYGTCELDGEFRGNYRACNINNLIIRGQGWTVGAHGGCRLMPYDPNYFVMEMTGTAGVIEGGFGFDNPYPTPAKGGLLISQLAGFGVPGSGVGQASTLNKIQNCGSSPAHWLLAGLYTVGVGDLLTIGNQWWVSNPNGAPGAIVHGNCNFLGYTPKYDAMMAGANGVPPIRHIDVEAHDFVGGARTPSGCSILACGISSLEVDGGIIDTSCSSQGNIIALNSPVDGVQVGHIMLSGKTPLYSENSMPPPYSIYVVPGSHLQRLTVNIGVTNSRTVSPYLGSIGLIDGSSSLS